MTAAKSNPETKKGFWKRELSINTQQLVTMALLVALDIVLSRFASFNVWNMRVGFGFLPIVIAGMLLGPVKAGLTAGVADVIGALLFPTGAFFPGFTVTAVLRGIMYGCLLKIVPEALEECPKKDWIFLSVVNTLFDQLVFALLLNSYWLSVLYGSTWGGLMASRIPQVAILIPVEFICIVFLPQLTDQLKPMLERKKSRH